MGNYKWEIWMQWSRVPVYQKSLVTSSTLNLNEKRRGSYIVRDLWFNVNKLMDYHIKIFKNWILWKWTQKLYYFLTYVRFLILIVASCSHFVIWSTNSSLIDSFGWMAYIWPKFCIISTNIFLYFFRILVV